MAIRLPNHFESQNRTAVLKAERPVDFTQWVGLVPPDELAGQLTSRNFLVTFSRVLSTINSESSIAYREVLVKVPVTYRGVDYLYPVLTWVDDEYSLIRGFLLGFHKRFIREHNREEFVLDDGDTRLDLRGGHATDSATSGAFPASPRPFLLHASFAVGDVEVDRINSLDVRNYELLRSQTVTGVTQPQTILGITATPTHVGETLDRFDVVGILSLTQ